MLKRMIARLLLFGIPFGVSYWASMPAAPVAGNQPLVVCAYPGERPGELRITLDPAGCSANDGGSKVAGAPVSIHPAVNVPRTMEDHGAMKSLNMPF